MLVVLHNIATMAESTKQRGSSKVNTDRRFEGEREREREREKETEER